MTGRRRLTGGRRLTRGRLLTRRTRGRDAMRLRRAWPRRPPAGSGGGPVARIAGRPDHRAAGTVVGCVAGLVAFFSGLVAFLTAFLAGFFGGLARSGAGAAAGCGSPSTLTLPSGWM